KPLPEREGFEHRIPGWIERTRRHRSESALASSGGSLVRDLDAARLDREVELVASETARDALQQTAGLLTTIHAHLITAIWSVPARAKADPTLVHLLRSVEEARKVADAAVTTAGGFFDTAYGSRESSPALIGSGLRHAASIACRVTRADEANKVVDLCALDDRLPVRDLTGIDFLLMMTPLIGLALALAAPNTTIRIEGEYVGRNSPGTRDNRLRDYLWVNRKAFGGQAGVFIVFTASAPPLSRARAEAWLKGEDVALKALPACGVVAGLQKCRGALGIALGPSAEPFQLLVALPT
ncbi:MAG: hypothetical protein ABIR80_06800, partial [Opitutaceae bacterium]